MARFRPALAAEISMAINGYELNTYDSHFPKNLFYGPGDDPRGGKQTDLLTDEEKTTLVQENKNRNQLGIFYSAWRLYPGDKKRFMGYVERMGEPHMFPEAESFWESYGKVGHLEDGRRPVELRVEYRGLRRLMHIKEKWPLGTPEVQ